MGAFGLLWRGMVIGVANIIPGVSGGTLALVLGVYERLIGALHNLSWRTVKAAAGLVRFSQESREVFAREWRRVDAGFVGLLGLGAVAAIVALASVMTYLLEQRHDPTYGFFFGLVAVSAWVPWRRIRRHSLAGVLALLVAAGGVVAMSQALGGEHLLAKERAKLALKLERLNTGAPQNEASLQPLRLAAMAGAGALAISAMILPGISGSFLLLLLGAYFDLLRAITHRELWVLGAFALGCGVGLVAFTRFLHWLLKRWHDPTMSCLVGLVIGSLWPIWPFKTSAQVGAETVYLANRWPPAWGGNETLTLAAAAAGTLLVVLSIRLEARRSKTDASA